MMTAIKIAREKIKSQKSETVEIAKNISHLLKKYRTALREESKFQNDQFDTGQLMSLRLCMVIGCLS